MYLMLKGNIYANNSIIFYSEIGEASYYSAQNNALQCITDFEPCCTRRIMFDENFWYRRPGQWFYPNGTEVWLSFTAITFYRNRGPFGNVNLNRLNNSLLFPTGLFCCAVPDVDMVNTTLCANIGNYTMIL